MIFGICLVFRRLLRTLVLILLRSNDGLNSRPFVSNSTSSYRHCTNSGPYHLARRVVSNASAYRQRRRNRNVGVSLRVHSLRTRRKDLRCLRANERRYYERVGRVSRCYRARATSGRLSSSSYLRRGRQGNRRRNSDARCRVVVRTVLRRLLRLCQLNRRAVRRVYLGAGNPLQRRRQ